MAWASMASRRYRLGVTPEPESVSGEKEAAYACHNAGRCGRDRHHDHGYRPYQAAVVVSATKAGGWETGPASLFTLYTQSS
jgi:hypothetical protein